MEKLVSFLLLIIAIGTLTDACDQMQNGCRIYKGQCSCGYGCSAEYRYGSIPSCRMALRGRQLDICTKQNPCLHSGLCSQITQEPGYQCHCANTGYYGPRCERRCPETLNLRSGGSLVHACISI